MSKAKYWFKPKPYGYGCLPITAEGWLLVLVILVIALLAAFANGIFFMDPETGRPYLSAVIETQQIIRTIVDLLLIGGLACLLCEKKMKESLKWRWGKK